MSVDSGLSGPFEGPAAAPPSRRTTATQRAARPRDDLPDAVLAEEAPDLATAIPRPERSGPRRRKGRRVTRVVRRIELWSVLKIALVFNTIMLGIVLGSVALLWGLANTTGLVDDLEGFLRDAGFEDFRFQGDRMFEQVAFIGAVGALAFTVFVVLAVALVNLISEITGGIRFSVIEEIPEAPPAGRAPAPLPAAAPAPLPPPPLAAPTEGGDPVASGFGPPADTSPLPAADDAPAPTPTRAQPEQPAPRAAATGAPSPRARSSRGSGAPKASRTPSPSDSADADATIPLAKPSSSAAAKKAARPRSSPPKKGRSGTSKGARTSSRRPAPDADGTHEVET